MLVEKKMVCTECTIIDDRSDKSHFRNHNDYGMTKIMLKNLETI